MIKETLKETLSWVNNPYLSVHPSAPLSERIAAEKPQLSENLSLLKTLLGNEKFISYIEPLSNINKSGRTLLITTGSELRRTYIERECIAQLKKAFDVTLVRVIALR